MRVEQAGYYTIENRALTAAGAASLSGDRLPMERTLRLTGTIAPRSAAVTLRFPVDNPAHYAAWRLRAMLDGRTDPKFDGTLIIEPRKGHSSGGWTRAAMLDAMAARAGVR